MLVLELYRGRELLQMLPLYNAGLRQGLFGKPIVMPTRLMHVLIKVQLHPGNFTQHITLLLS